MSEQHVPQKMELVAMGLRDRIGQLVSQYETDMAVIRAEAQEQLQAMGRELQRVSAELADLKGVSEETEEKPGKSTEAA